MKFEICWVGIFDLAFFLQAFEVCPLFLQKKHSLSINGHTLGFCWPEHLKHLEFWLLVGILESIFETDSAADFDSFYIIADCLIADSSDKEMSIAFCSVRLAPSLSRCCCVRSWFTQQTKRSRNILSNESSYSQYWLNLLNSAIHWLVIYPMPGNNATLRINFTDLRKWNFVRSLFETVLHKWYTCYE